MPRFTQSVSLLTQQTILLANWLTETSDSMKEIHHERTNYFRSINQQQCRTH